MPSKLCLIIQHFGCNHALFKSLLVLALHAVLDCVEDSIHSGLGLEARLGAVLEDTSLDQDRVPVGVRVLFIVFIRTSNVRFRCVADKVNSRGRRVNTMCVLAPFLEEASSELEGTNLRLAECRRLKGATSDSLEHGFQRNAERAHANAGEVVRSAPDHVVVGEEDGWAFIIVLRPGAKAALLGHEKVQNDLLVRSPIARVGKDEDGLNFNLSKVSRPRVSVLFLCKFAEWRGILVILDDIARCDSELSVSMRHASRQSARLTHP